VRYNIYQCIICLRETLCDRQFCRIAFSVGVKCVHNALLVCSAVHYISSTFRCAFNFSLLLLRVFHSFVKVFINFYASLSPFSLFPFLTFILLYRSIFLRFIFLFGFHSHFICLQFFAAFPSPSNDSPNLVNFLLPTRIYIILLSIIVYVL
jgi:hypothetical protein